MIRLSVRCARAQWLCPTEAYSGQTAGRRKQQVLLQMLQSLLNKVACETAVPGLDTLVSSTVLLLLTSLRSTYSAMPQRKEVMGETYVGLLDATAGETNTSQTYSASLQVRARQFCNFLSITF